MADFQWPGFLPVLAASCSPSVMGCSLIQLHGLSLHAHLVLCCALPTGSSSLMLTAQHGVLGKKDALALTLLGELGRSAPEADWPQITTVKESGDIGSKGRKRLSSPKQYSCWGPPLNRT